MKKTISVALIAVMIFTLASCSLFVENDNKNKTEASTTVPTTPPTTTTLATTSDGGNDAPVDGHRYAAFSPDEEKLFVDLFGEGIPFIPNDEYYIEEYSIPFDYKTMKGILFLTYGNTQQEFDTYRDLFASYDSYVYTDDSGKLCYMYGPECGTYCIEMSYYESEGSYLVLVNAFCEVKGGTEGNGTGIPYDELITNEGAGLPNDADGVYDVDFTKGEYIKNVTNQDMYIDGCPPIGSPGVLVIPVQFSDVTAESQGFTIDTLVEVFSKNGKTDYHSIYDYYYISSYGQLTLDITVLDFWFTPQYDSQYYDQFSFMHEGEEITHGEQLILNEALDYLDDIMDLSQFDSDHNGSIDSVVLVNTLEIDSSDYFHWAIRHFNLYRDDAGSYHVYDGVHAIDYMWLSYRFLYSVRDEHGNEYYDNTAGMDTMTFIHEFGHVLGLDDYYDYTRINFPLFGFDIMDNAYGDQNAYSKFNLGWLTASRLVVANESITLTLEDFSKNGDTIIIANNWDDTLGAYQEYYILVYYTNTGLNAGDKAGYFDTEGIVVYHVNAAIYMPKDGEYYDVYNRNTDAVHERGTENNLIEYVKSSADAFVYGVGDTMPAVTDDYGNELAYSFTVDALTGEYATITFRAK